jgi:hypothetical protein
MAATGRHIEQYDPNPELGQEKKGEGSSIVSLWMIRSELMKIHPLVDETLKELLMLLQASFHDVRNDFTALSQRVLQHVYSGMCFLFQLSIVTSMQLS